MKMTFIDTHCHLNFKRFNKTRDQVISEAHTQEVETLIIPGTDIFSSRKALEITKRNEGIYAAVGIHPHHTYSTQHVTCIIENDIRELEKLIIHPKVVAVGEVGLDAHVYEETKYDNYQIDKAFMDVQTEYFIAQLHLAHKHKKALIIHNRETKNDLLRVFDAQWKEEMRYRAVFHCCEPDEELLIFAQEHNIFIGIDGDVTYGGDKAAFVKKVPLDIIVLETDSPYLLPEPLRAQKLYPNTPANIPLIAQCIAKIKGVSIEEVAEATTRNARRLFDL